jgi:hypothetical protein
MLDGVGDRARGGGVGGDDGLSRVGALMVSTIRTAAGTATAGLSASVEALLTRHAPALLRREHAAAKALFSERLPSGAWLLQPRAVLRLLGEEAPHELIETLQAMHGGALEGERAAAASALAEALLERLLSPPRTEDPTSALTFESDSELLLRLLRGCRDGDVDLERCLESIVNGARADEPRRLGRHRLLLLGLLGRFDEAVDLLVGPLNDLELAVEFCGGEYSRAPSSSPSPSPPLFVRMLERFVHPAGGAPPMLKEATALLQRWPENVSAVEALRRLPPQTLIAEIESGIASLLRESKERLRATQLRAALLRAVSLQTRAELQKKRGRRLVVHEDTECAICGRRLGNAAFIWLANGTFAHIGCGPNANPFGPAA